MRSLRLRTTLPQFKDSYFLINFVKIYRNATKQPVDHRVPRLRRLLVEQTTPTSKSRSSTFTTVTTSIQKAYGHFFEDDTY